MHHVEFLSLITWNQIVESAQEQIKCVGLSSNHRTITKYLNICIIIFIINGGDNVGVVSLLLQVGLCIGKNLVIQYVSIYRGYNMIHHNILQYCKQGSVLQFIILILLI